jgi:ribonuclease G
VVPPAKLLVESDPLRLRIALLEGDRLAELHVDGEAPSRVGEIYLGKIQRLVPAIDAAFVDIGLERNAFLHSSDFAGPDEAAPPAAHQPMIVQVFRDELPGKGARTLVSVTRMKLVLSVACNWMLPTARYVAFPT